MAEVQDYDQFEQTNPNANGDFTEQIPSAESESMDTNQNTDLAGGDVVPADDGTNEDDRKLFVGGLSWETTTKDLKEYFSKFGEVVNCTLKTDLETKRSRGFGFIVFAKTETVDKVLNLEEKEQLKLHGRVIDPKRANPRTGARKIFVGRVDPACSEEDIKAYFCTFGKVEKIDLPFDKIKDQRRAFCFVEFDNEEAVKKVLDQPKHVLSGQEVDIKKATPNSQGRGGGRGGRGGRGGWNQGWGGQGYNQGYSYGYGNQGYGGYGGGYGGYGGAYDYNQGYGYGGWGGYDQSYGSYGGYGGYDYSGWGGYGQDQSQQQSTYGKTGGSKRGGGNSYHPYSH